MKTFRSFESVHSRISRRPGGQISRTVFRVRGITGVGVGVEAPGSLAHLSHLLPAFGKKSVAGRPQPDVRVHRKVLGGFPRNQVHVVSRPGQIFRRKILVPFSPGPEIGRVGGRQDRSRQHVVAPVRPVVGLSVSGSGCPGRVKVGRKFR